MKVDSFFQKSVVQNAPRLFLDVGKNNFRVVFFHFFDEFDDDVGAGGVNDRNVSHPQNQYLRRFAYFLKKVRYLGSPAEKQRTGKSERHHAFFVQDLCQVAAAAVFFQHLFVGFNFDFPTHAVHKDNAGHDEADADGGVEVDQNGQKQGDDKGVTVAARSLQQFEDFSQPHHVPADQNQHRRQAGQRNVFGGRRQQQHKQQQKY